MKTNFKLRGATQIMKTALLILAVLTGNPGAAQAEVKNYLIENQKFSMDVPSGWRDAENIAGSPLVFFGPESVDGPRSIVLVSPTGKEDSKKFFKGMKANAAEYKKGREEWLKGNLGESISYDPYQEEKWPGIEKAYAFGYSYDIPSGKFHERSVYILCGGNKVFYIKSLVPEEFQSDHRPLVEQTIKSLKCEKTVKTASK